MKKLLLVLILLLAPSLAFAQCNGVFPPLTICGTVAGGIPKPVSTSVLTGIPGGSNGQIQFNNAGAFGGFAATVDVPTGAVTASVNFYFCSGSPWVDVRCFGAVGDNATDNSPLIQAAVNFAEGLSNSSRVYIPPGNYCLKSGPIQTNAAHTWISGSTGGTILDACGVDNTLVQLNQFQNKLTDISLFGKGVNNDTGTFGASNPALIINVNCIECLLDYIFVLGGSYPIQTLSGESYIYRTRALQGYGSALFYSAGGGWFNRMKLDQGPPHCPVVSTTILAWAPSTAYTNCTTVSLSGYIIQAVGNGTSDSSPPTLKNYGINIIDNTQTWQLARPVTYHAYQMDTGAVENFVDQIDMSGYFSSSFSMTNSLAGAPPTSFFCKQCVLSGSTNANIELLSGSHAYFTDTSIGQVFGTNAVGVLLGPSWTGPFQIRSGYISAGAGNTGIAVLNGISTTIDGVNIIGGGSGVGVAFGANISDFIVTNNHVTNFATGIKLTVGTSDYYNVVNNICTASTTTCINDPVSGAHSTVSGNH